MIMQDLPVMYLQGGAILPVGPPIKHVGEASLEDDLSLLVSLDENGMHYTPFTFCSLTFCPG
jgi:alpha-glucosidase